MVVVVAHEIGYWKKKALNEGYEIRLPANHDLRFIM